MLSQGVGASMQSTPKSVALPLTSLPDASETSHASSATPTKGALNIPGQPITPESGRGTALNEITPGKIAEVTSPKPTSAPATLAESPETPHNGDDTDVLKIVDGEVSVGPSDASTTKSRKSTTNKRSRSTPSKKTAKKLFKDQDAPGKGDNDTCADVAAELSSGDDI